MLFLIRTACYFLSRIIREQHYYRICIDKYQIIDTFVANGQLFSNFLFVAVVFFVFSHHGDVKENIIYNEKEWNYIRMWKILHISILLLGKSKAIK